MSMNIIKWILSALFSVKTKTNNEDQRSKPLRPESKSEFIDYVEILGTYSAGDVAFLKSLLESENISYFFKGEHFMYVQPLADPVRLMVRKDQSEKAIELLKEVNYL